MQSGFKRSSIAVNPPQPDSGDTILEANMFGYFHNGPKFRRRKLLFGLAIFVIVVIVIALIVYFVGYSGKAPAVDNDGNQQDAAAAATCSKDSDCAKSAVCGSDATTGCCPKCGKSNGQCVAGMVTASGCVESESNAAASDRSDSNDQHKIKNDVSAAAAAYGMPPMMMRRGAGTHGNDTRQQPRKRHHDDNDSGVTEDSCSSHKDAYQRACVDKGNLSPSCCGVCVNGLAYPGVRGPDGICQTTVQQMGYPGLGPQPPNTYIVSSSGPKYGISMGGCTVDPIGSSLAIHSGIYRHHK